MVDVTTAGRPRRRRLIMGSVIGGVLALVGTYVSTILWILAVIGDWQPFRSSHQRVSTAAIATVVTIPTVVAMAIACRQVRELVRVVREGRGRAS